MGASEPVRIRINPVTINIIIVTINRYVGTPNIFDDSLTPLKLIKVTRDMQIREIKTLYGASVGKADTIAAVEDDILTATVNI